MSVYKLLVRPYHCDAYGHVNNARYLEFFEEARWQLLSSPALDQYLQTNNTGMVVVSIHVHYQQPALPSQLLHISAVVKETGNSSITIEQHINFNDKPVASATVKLVFIDLKSGKPQKISDELRNIMQQQ